MVTPWLLASTAFAGSVDPALVERRVAEIASLRSKRVTQDAPAIDPAHYAKAAAGDTPTALESVEGHSAKKAYGLAVVDVPIGKMWAAINDKSSKVDATALGYLEILDGKNCQNGRVVLQYLPLSLVSDRWWVVRQDMNPALQEASEGRVREVRWSSTKPSHVTTTAQSWMDKGMSVAYTHGSWLLVDLDGEHTLIEYYTWSDPGGRVPAGLASTFAAGGISDTLKTMSDLGRRGARCPVH